jgi:hypothetical protein
MLDLRSFKSKRGV